VAAMAVVVMFVLTVLVTSRWLESSLTAQLMF
jgi:hypothetical protein